MSFLKIIGFLIRFYPLVSLAVRIAEEAGDENGWPGEEKKRHAVQVFMTLVNIFGLELPEGFAGRLSQAIDTLVAIFNAVGKFLHKPAPNAPAPAAAPNDAPVAAAAPDDAMQRLKRLAEAERQAREEFAAIERKNAK